MTKTNYKDFEVVIVSDETQQPYKVPDLPYKTVMLNCSKKTDRWVGGMMVLNTGFLYALKQKADVVLIQNAECYHVGDVITKAASVTDRNYISFGCYSLDEETTFSKHDIFEVIKKSDRGARIDGENAWYNHPTKRPVGYHFCSAITAANLKKLNGFDERYMDGVAYDDNDFLSRIRLLRLRIDITEDPFVVHQWHFSGHGAIPNKSALIEKNKELYMMLKRNGNIRAKHLITEDL
jgi:GT2 family glycosyltransferase